MGDQPIPAVTPEVLTRDQRENLEKNGYVLAGGNSIPGRMMAAVVIQRWDRLFLGLDGEEIISALQGEFVVPDECGETPIVPVTPKIALVTNWPDSSEDESAVRTLNRQISRAVKHYVVARNLAECPL
jgi:hypothetical protein